MAGLKGKFTKGTVEEIAKREGCSVAKVQRDIRNLGADRRGEQSYERWVLVHKLRDQGKTIKEICEDKKVRKAFNAGEGKSVSKESIRRYLRMTEEELEAKMNPNRQNPVLNKHNIGKAKNLVWSSGPTKKCLQDIFEMHIKEDYIDCDLTYSIGNFYKNTGIPEPKNKFDKYPDPAYPDVRHLEEVNNLSDGCFSSIIIDPPFVIRGQKEGVSSGITVDRFSGYKDYNDLVESNRWLIATAGRLLKEDGILVYKIQDTVSSGRQIWTHTKIEKFAADNYLDPVEMYLCDNQSNLPIKAGEQKHARKAFSFIYTFKKVAEKTRRKLEQTFDRGMKALNERNYEEAISLLTSSATEGHRESMFTLGDMYYRGKGVDTDTYQAIYWLKMAADKGSVGALFVLGQIYYNMPPSEENTRKALEYYTKAYLLNPKYALYVGIVYLDGRYGVDKENLHHIEEGLPYVEEAFNSGKMLAGLYMWKMLRMLGRDEESEDYYAIEQLLRFPYQLNQWARALCEWGEYEKALPYIERCMDVASKYEYLRPSFLDTYAEILYGLGRLDESKEMFNQCLAKYTEKDERRSVYETQEKIRKKFVE